MLTMSLYHQLKQQLLTESKKHGWGILLVTREHLKRWILKVKPKRLLDIGCHNRYLENTIREWFREVETFGIDIVKYDVKPSAICSAELLPFRDNYFDFVTVIETLEHIVDYVCALKEIHRVLKPNGYLYIQSVRCDFKNAVYGDDTHFHVLHPVTLTRLCKLIGFEYVEDGIEKQNFYIVFRKGL